MTKDELNRLPWKRIMHLSTWFRVNSVYVAEIHGYEITKSVKTLKDKNGNPVSTETHYKWRGGLYYSDEYVLQAINSRAEKFFLDRLEALFREFNASVWTQCVEKYEDKELKMSIFVGDNEVLELNPCCELNADTIAFHRKRKEDGDGK